MTPRITVAPSTPIAVGRSEELERLQRALGATLAGSSSLVLVTGEAGIGKTTLLDRFHAAMPDRADLAWARGQCVERYGPEEPFMPLLEALSRLCRGDDGEDIIDALDRHAPSWLSQLPFAAPEDSARGTVEQGGSQERLLRELLDALIAITRRRALVLVLEDIHWSDGSTLDFVRYFVRRCAELRLLVIATARPETPGSEERARAAFDELRGRERVQTLALEPLQLETVAEYLRARFATEPSRHASEALYRQSGGNPLFLRCLIDYLDAERAFVASERGLDLERVPRRIPADLQLLIDEQLRGLNEQDRGLLEAASLAGTEFSAQELAALLEAELSEVEARCEALAQRGQFIRALGVEAWPDGTLGSNFAFVHALYQSALYARVGAGRRARLHRKLGEHKQSAFGAHASEIAAELAEHFAHGSDYATSAVHHGVAARVALERHAHRDALAHASAGLELNQLTARDDAALARELPLQLTRALALVPSRGYAAPEVEAAFVKALEISQELAQTPALFPALRGLCVLVKNRGQLAKALRIAERMQELAEGDPLRLAHALCQQGEILLFQGKLAAAEHALQRALSIYEPARDGPGAHVYGQDAAVMSLADLALLEIVRGAISEAMQHAAQAIALASELNHPFSQAFALWYAASVAQANDDPARALELGARVRALAEQHEFLHWKLLGGLLESWAEARRDGPAGTAYATLAQGIAAHAASGAGLGRAYFLGLLADAACATGRLSEARAALDEAQSCMERTGERVFEPELDRLRGELLLLEDPNAHEPAGACFERALENARAAGARTWQLRAALRLADIHLERGELAQARATLLPVFQQFTEADVSPLLDAARARISRTGPLPNLGVRREPLLADFDVAPEPTPLSVRLAQLGAYASDSALAPATRTTGRCCFQREGDCWVVGFDGPRVRVLHTAGMGYIAELLRRPYERVPALALASGGASPDLRPLQAELAHTLSISYGQGVDTGLDLQATRAYKQRIADLKSELEEAERHCDRGRSERLQAELEFISEELRRSLPFRGKSRKLASSSERARINVTRAIKVALRRLETHDAELAAHLAASLRTGGACSYSPAPSARVEWAL